MNMKASMMNIKGSLATIYSHLFKELPVLLGYGLWGLKIGPSLNCGNT